MATIFKQIIDKKIPAKVVYEDDLCMAFHDINPEAPVHILIIPKKELASLNETQKEDKNLMGHLMLKAKEIAKNEGVKNYRLVINTGKEAGQTVFHLHIHLMAGRNFSWP